jgi:hypothetical protein
VSTFRYVTQPAVADSLRRITICLITLIAAFRGEVMIFALGMVSIGVTLVLNDYPKRARSASDEHHP